MDNPPACFFTCHKVCPRCGTCELKSYLFVAEKTIPTA